MDGGRELTRSFEALLRGLLPWLFQVQRGPILARVLRTHDAAGRASELEPRYSVDVRPLTPEGDEDTSWPDLPDVEISPLWIGAGRGVWCMPPVGAVVRVGFMYGDASRPYVEGPTAYGFDVPAHPHGRFLIQSGNARLEITPAGDIDIVGGTITADGQVLLGSSGAIARVVLTSCPCPMVPVPGNGHLVGATKVKGV